MKFLPVIVVFWLSADMVLGNGFSLPDQDAFATGRGEAFVATANNPSAIYYNPAGITQLNGNNLRGGIYGIYLSPSYNPPAGAPNSGTTYRSSDFYDAVPQGFYTHTFTNSILSLGLGVYAPFGGDIDWPQNTGFRSVATQGRLTYLTVNPVAALKLSPHLSIGAGLMVNYVNLFFEQGLRPTALTPNFYQFKGDGWSVGYNLGVLIQPIKQISFGATFRSLATVNLNGQSEFELSASHIPETILPAEMSLTFPINAVVGVSYRPTPKWNIEFDANYTDWASFGMTSINQTGSFPLGSSPDVPVTLDWQASWMYEVGVTRYLRKGWHISAGYAFNQNSVPNAYYTPLAADMDRHFFSLGLGHNSGRFDFDIAYQFGYGPPHTVTDSTASTPLGGSTSADGTYHFISDAVILTAGIHF